MVSVPRLTHIDDSNRHHGVDREGSGKTFSADEIDQFVREYRRAAGIKRSFKNPISGGSGQQPRTPAFTSRPPPDRGVCSQSADEASGANDRGASLLPDLRPAARDETRKQIAGCRLASCPVPQLTKRRHRRHA